MVFQKYKHSPLRMRGGGIVDAISTQSARVTGIVKPLMIDAFRLLHAGGFFGCGCSSQVDDIYGYLQKLAFVIGGSFYVCPKHLLSLD